MSRFQVSVVSLAVIVTSIVAIGATSSASARPARARAATPVPLTPAGRDADDAGLADSLRDTTATGMPRHD